MGVYYFRVQDNRMQAQAQISGHVSGQTGQVGRQLPGLAQQNGSSLASQTSNHGGIRRSWHTDTDLFSVRQFIIEKILQVFQRRSITQEWQLRLPEFVRRLEEGLFKEAASKEEYVDLTTLERRLQFMVKRFQPPNSRNQNLSHHNPPPVRTMIPTQGLQQSGNVSSTIPTPGTDISTVYGPGSSNVVPNTSSMGNMLPNRNDSSSNMHGNSLMGTDGSRSKMVPTLGLTGNMFSNNGDNISSLPGQLNNAFHSQQGVTYSQGHDANNGYAKS